VARKAHAGGISDHLVGKSPYNIHYTFGSGQNAKLVSSVSLRELYARYENILWEDGKHKYNVSAFIREINEILYNAEFSIFTQEMLDEVIGTLRGRGNSNATINRKMAALSKLLRMRAKWVISTA